MIGVCVNRNNYPKEDASEFDLTRRVTYRFPEQEFGGNIFLHREGF